MRERARSELPAEPNAGTGSAASEDDGATLSVVIVRVRLPNGAMHQRRFPAESSIHDVRMWVSTLDEMPLTATASSDKWKLVTSYPRTQPDGQSSVLLIAAGAGAVALFVEMD